MSASSDVFQEVFAGLGGCDNSCAIRRPQGMGTNGGCRCNEREIRRALQKAKQEILRLRGICEMCETLRRARGSHPDATRWVIEHQEKTGHTV